MSGSGALSEFPFGDPGINIADAPTDGSLPESDRSWKGLARHPFIDGRSTETCHAFDFGTSDNPIRHVWFLPCLVETGRNMADDVVGVAGYPTTFCVDVFAKAVCLLRRLCQYPLQRPVQRHV